MYTGEDGICFHDSHSITLALQKLTNCKLKDRHSVATSHTNCIWFSPYLLISNSSLHWINSLSILGNGSCSAFWTGFIPSWWRTTLRHSIFMSGMCVLNFSRSAKSVSSVCLSLQNIAIFIHGLQFFHIWYTSGVCRIRVTLGHVSLDLPSATLCALCYWSCLTDQAIAVPFNKTRVQCLILCWKAYTRSEKNQSCKLISLLHF